MHIDPSLGGQWFQVLAIAFAAITGSALIFTGRIRMDFAKLGRSMRKDGGEEAGQETISETQD